jgi:diguanylate cyclase (GGDEF)-like protein/PAS domain S-box-containing protein
MGRMIDLRREGVDRITLERNRAEAELIRANNELRLMLRARAMTTECSRALVRTTEENRLLQEMCRIGVESGGYLVAWIGLARYDTAKTIEPVAVAGDHERYFESVRISWADDEYGNGPAGLAVRTGTTQVTRDAASDLRFKTWRKEALARGYLAVAALPLVHQGEIYGVFGLFSGDAETFGAQEIELLEELANDIAYGIFNLRTRAARRQAELVIERSEQRFRTTFDLAPVGINHIDPEGGILLANPRMGQILGYTPGELIGRNIKEFSLPEDEEGEKGFWTLREKLYAGEIQSISAERRYRHKDGSPVLAAITITVQRDAEGRPLYDIALLEDITGRKREERLLALEHSVTRCLAEADSAPAALQLVIRAICESEGWDCGRYFRWEEREGVLRFGGSWNMPGPAIEQFIARSREVTYGPGVGLSGRVWQTGGPLWVSDITRDPRVSKSLLARDTGMHGAFVFPVISEGKTIGVLAFNTREVREPEERLLQAIGVIGSQIGQFLQRKQGGEELRRFRAAMDASADLILLVDPVRLRYVDVNDAACRALGYSREEFLTMGPQDIFSISREELSQLYDRLINGDRSEETVEGWYSRKDGSRLQVESFRRAVRSPDGNIVVAVARDITERRLREEELRRFRLALDNSADMIVLIDRTTMRFVDVNATACNLLGYSREEMLEMGPHDLLPVSRAQLERSYDELIASPSLNSGMNAHYRRKDGSLLPFESTRRVLRSGDTTIIAAISRDIRERIASEEALQESNERFDTAVRATNDVIWDWNLLTDALWWNENFSKVFGYPSERVDPTAKSRYDGIHPGDRDRVVTGIRRMIESGEADWSDEYRFGREDGSYAHVFDRGHVIHNDDGKAVRMIGAMADITSRKEAEDKARNQALQQRLIAEFGQDVLASADLAEVRKRAVELVAATLKAEFCDVLELIPDGKQVLYKAAVGWPEEWVGLRTVIPGPGSNLEYALSTRETVVIEDLQNEKRFAPSQLVEFGIRSTVRAPILGTKGAFGLLRAHWREPRQFTEDEVSFLRNVANILAVAIERKNAEEHLAYLAQFDALTGLPNRHLLHDRMLQTMAQGRRSGNPMAVLYIDLDRFKLVNDTQGHGAGDKLLKEAAARLTQCIRSGDTVGRFGGDEFGAVLSDLAKPGDASVVAQKILDALARPFDLDGHETYVSASVGITLFPADSEEAGALIMNADTAMYRAKEQGRNTYQYFTREMNERALARVQDEAALRRALERKEFLLHYQPKADLESGVICGFEALLRWQHPERGMVSPVEFIPVLEDAGLIVPVGEWVMREVCRQIQAWKNSGLAVPPVAVNLSARQFLQKDLEATVRFILRETGVDPSLIQFELTESLLMKEPEAAARTLRGLKESGVKISVDDFGTGYSSLAYLKRFPIDALKIDRAFVRDVTTNPEDAAITLAIIGLAHNLKLKVVAEGVETEGQLNFLSTHACDEMQGFYFSRPVSPSECEAMMREGRRLGLPAGGAAAKAAVLLLDDDETDLMLLERILRPDGFPVLKTTDPKRAFELLASHPVGIVISDQCMPGLTGVEFLSHVRKLYPDVIRIIVTGSRDPKVIADAVNEAGVHKFLMKDWDGERVRAEMREVSRRYRSRTAAKIPPPGHLRP